MLIAILGKANFFHYVTETKWNNNVFFYFFIIIYYYLFKGPFAPAFTLPNKHTEVDKVQDYATLIVKQMSCYVLYKTKSCLNSVPSSNWNDLHITILIIVHILVDFLQNRLFLFVLIKVDFS